MIAEQLLAPVPGGIGRYTRELAAALARSAAPGDEVDSWTAWHRNAAPARIDGVRGPRRLPLPRRGLAAAWENGIGPAPRGSDVVHAPSLLVPPRRRTPLVVSIHDAVPWTHPDTLTSRGARWHRAMAERAVASGATIGVLTDTVAAQLLDVLPGLTPDRIRLLGAGVPSVLRREPDADRVAALRARLGLPGAFLLTLATLEPRKGLDVLVAALAKLGPDAPPLVVVGQPGWGGVDLPGAAREAGLADARIRILGRTSDADLAVLLHAATALIAPSRAEGFGLPVAEAMAAGTPVVCSDAPALVEVAGDAAIVVPRGDAARLAEAIDGLLEDSALRERLGAAGLRRSRVYDWATVADRSWQLYRELVAGAAR